MALARAQVIWAILPPQTMLSKKKIYAVDLFCGVGGLTYGLRTAGRIGGGIVVKAGIDNDSSCREAYEKNNPGAEFVSMDIRNITPAEINAHYAGADVKVLVGCAPCQPFSAHTRKNRDRSKGDDCSLLQVFSRLIRKCEPDIVSIENVPGLQKHEVFERFMKDLERLGYHCARPEIVFCPQYGVPQKRKRLVVLASRLGEIKLIPPTHESPDEWPTVKDAMRRDSLQPIEHGKRAKKDPCHEAMRLTAKNFERIKQSTPGGNWRDWDKSIVSKCHKKAYYPAPYGRMEWNAPAPTITTQFCYYSTGRFGHPDQHRAISLREGALLQTFPMNYQFQNAAKPLTAREIARHIGNAVPVNLAKAIGKSIWRHVDA
ncbi:MAG: DNA cytosine methyltransferase [Gammaproteobacteria bacterium]|nr:DNA cytosine methyltransferase [Gammaproteobacteria bacterium]